MAIDITTELSTIASEPKGALVKQAIYDALDKLSKGGGPGPEPKPIDPNEFLPGSAHVRYYYSIAQGRIGISTANPGEINPVPPKNSIQVWPQGTPSSSYDTVQTVTADVKGNCTLLAVVMHRYNQNYPHGSGNTGYGIRFFKSDDSALDDSWGSPIYESYACGTGSGTVGAEQYVSVYKKEIAETSMVTGRIRYVYNQTPSSTSSGYSNRLALCLVAVYDVEEMLLVDNKLADGGVDLDPRPLDISSATGKQRLYIASTWTGNNSFSDQIWFTNDQPQEYYADDHINDFMSIWSGDGRLALAFDAEGGHGKPWVIDRPSSSIQQYQDDINYLSIDIKFKDDTYIPPGCALLACTINGETRYLELGNGRLMTIKDS